MAVGRESAVDGGQKEGEQAGQSLGLGENLLGFATTKGQQKEVAWSRSPRWETLAEGRSKGRSRERRK